MKRTWVGEDEEEEEEEEEEGVPQATPSATGPPSKKRVINTGIAVVSKSYPLSGKPVSKAPNAANSQKQSSGQDNANASKKTLNENATVGARYGGLEDEDDNAEWEAIKQSPLKGRGVRVSDSTLVKVDAPAQPKLPTKISEFRTEHLPAGSFGKWRKLFITTFALYIGTMRMPWAIKGRDSFGAMQDCWNHIYKGTAAAGYTIEGVHDVVFVLSDQRWKEMRNVIATAALQAIEDHFITIGATTNVQRRDAALKLSKKSNWMYGDVKRNDSGKLVSLEKPFYGPFVLKALGAFFKWTKNHDDKWQALIGQPQIGALGLAMAAVERAVTFWSDLPITASTANLPAVKPFNKRKDKTVKTEPADDHDWENAAGSDTEKPKNDGNTFGKINEFNSDLWSKKTNDWISGALDKGYDSTGLMQPLVDAALQHCWLSARQAARHSDPVVSGPSSPSRRKIVEGAVSDDDD